MKKALTPGGGYDYEQHDAYVETMNQYIAVKEINQRLKVASGAFFVKGAKENLEERVDKVAKGELSGGFLEKASNLFNKFMTQAHTMLDFSSGLKKIQEMRKAKEKEINKLVDLLSEGFNIDNLETHKKHINNQRPNDINAEIIKLRAKAIDEGNRDIHGLYQVLIEEERKAGLLEAKCNLLDAKITEATQNLKTLKTDVKNYVVARQNAWFNDFINEFVEEYFPELMTEDQKGKVKISAAEKLQEEIQTGAAKYNEVEKNAKTRDSLGVKAGKFKLYKDQFSSDIGKLKNDPGESTQVKNT